MNISDYLQKIAENQHEKSEIIISKILKERIRQNAKWGVQRHEPAKWLQIIVEEVGEVAQAQMIESIPGSAKETDKDDEFTELIHVMAVCMARCEQILEERRVE